MTTLQEAVALAEADKGLAVVSTLRADATIQSTIVNAGIIDHPESGETVLALVSAGKVRQANLRARPQISATFRSGWRYPRWRVARTSPAPTIRNPGFAPKRCLSYCATSSPPPVAATTTGLTTTTPRSPNAEPRS